MGGREVLVCVGVGTCIVGVIEGAVVQETIKIIMKPKYMIFQFFLNIRFSFLTDFIVCIMLITANYYMDD
jgi:hypothetical protein